MTVSVSAEVFYGLDEIRESGETTMFDRRSVQYIADREEYYALVCWLEDHPNEYARGIFEGFEIERAR